MRRLRAATQLGKRRLEGWETAAQGTVRECQRSQTREADGATASALLLHLCRSNGLTNTATAEVEKQLEIERTKHPNLQRGGFPDQYYALQRRRVRLVGISILNLVRSQRHRHPGGIEYALSFFHSCFANTTLTFPVKINPWRACLPSIHDDFPSVRYAAAALAKRQQAHFDRKPESASILRLKSQALSIFASHLNDLSFECGLSTVLLLIGLDYAETGVANWNIHLRGAYRILESHGGIRLAESRPNLRSQIAMLIWYDVNAALISRRGPTFPRTYIEALMAWQDDDEWSMLGLNGLPDGMFLDMHRLAVAAADIDSADPEALELIRKNILGTEIGMEQGKYQALMSEIWRLGLLLYIARVFWPVRIYDLAAIDDQDDTDTFASHEGATEWDIEPRSVAIQILTMVANIPSHSSFQKQCLMPIVLAGCEMSSAEWAFRKIATEYSERWKQKTGIWIFDSGLEFMRGVWAKNDMAVLTEAEDEVDRPWVPWTEIYPPSAEYGFLFG
ncbi:Fungal specific transcription factor domain-containing protein [Cladophialophora immunda]|nr:Fungal specific transcription factor domain-containing protein [Cladophialophora immunda]